MGSSGRPLALQASGKDMGQVMGIQALNNAARAAGYALAPPTEVFDDAPTATSRPPIPEQTGLLLPAVTGAPRSRARAWRRLVARTRARLHMLATGRRGGPWRGYVAALTHSRPTPA